jgi:excinuclease ABC subunit A
MIPCPTCRGRRFNAATLEVRFKQHSAADILDMRVEQALELFSEFEPIHDRLSVLAEAGLGYLTLGQPAATFSGGETQRIRLATELFIPDQAHTLFILDEPTAGLHPHDVSRLMLIISKLIAKRHSIIVIEHNLDVIRAADWVIDIGPDCGPMGGQLVFAGTPEAMRTASGHTADALRASHPISNSFPKRSLQFPNPSAPSAAER